MTQHDKVTGEYLVAKKKRSRKRSRPTLPSTESRTVDRYLAEVGFHPRKIADEFWNDLALTFGKRADDFRLCVDTRAVGDAKSADYQQNVRTLYERKNASLDFSIEITSQYFGRLYEGYLSMVESLGLNRSARTVLDVGCDNGVLTNYYARLFPKSTVVGIDLCGSGLECARQLAIQLKNSSLAFVNGDAFSETPPNALENQTWDIIFMTLCGYEQVDRGSSMVLAKRLMSYLSPGGDLVVMEYPNTDILFDLQILAHRCETWTLTYEAFGGDDQQVYVSRMRSKSSLVS